MFLKPGDVVQRINKPYFAMSIGEFGVVREYGGSHFLLLDGFEETFTTENFKLMWTAETRNG